MKKKTISIVIPLYNEEKVLRPLYSRLNTALKKDFTKFKYEILFIDDGSTDKTFNILTELHKKDSCIKVLRFSRNFGHHIAVTAGLDNASGDYVVLMDGDLQDKPEEIFKLYKKLSTGFDVVYAKRIKKKFNLLKRINSTIFNLLFKIISDESLPATSSIFRIMTQEVVQSVTKCREHERYVIGLIGWVGYNQTYQEVEHGNRYRGKSKYSLTKQLKLALNALFSFSNFPLRLFLRVGFIFLLISVVMIFYVLLRKFVYNTVIVGWSSLLISMFFIGGIQTIMLGLIGEYISRIYTEVKKRPLYFVSQVLE